MNEETRRNTDSSFIGLIDSWILDGTGLMNTKISLESTRGGRNECGIGQYQIVGSDFFYGIHGDVSLSAECTILLEIV